VLFDIKIKGDKMFYQLIKYMKKLKVLIPRKYRPKTKEIYFKLWENLLSSLYKGHQFVCPCCNGHFRKFLPYGDRINSQCPKCGATERHRLLCLYLKNKKNLLFCNNKIKLLHIGPEYCIQRLLLNLPHIEYVSVDLEEPLAMIRADITNIPFKNDSFDVIICLHVLEHIVDDQKAMRELFRVLKPGGWGILQSPIDIKREITFEDPTVTSREDRARLFGQSDHVRIYGLDYKKRLENAGFIVKVDTYVKELGEDIIQKYGLMWDEDIYFCIKPKISGGE
jgi:predicted SAM-dependent methyltransferase